MAVYKNGTWKNSIYEPPFDYSHGIAYNNEPGDYVGLTWSHTPTTESNSTFIIGTVHHDDNPGKRYHLSLTVQWSNFTTDMPENFDIYWQGYYYNTTTTTWTYGNSPELSAMQSVKTLNDLVKASASGLYRYEVDFTTSSNITEARLRYRSNYSNGVGTLTFSDLHVVPIEDYLSEKEVKEFEDKTIAQNFIEI